jgi:hypothetical protein
MWKLANGYDASNDKTAPPPEFICPITEEVMTRPVVTEHGRHFERSAIQQWFDEGYDFCPLTGKPLKPSDLVKDARLKLRIQVWKERTGYGIGSMHDEEVRRKTLV